MVVPMAATVVQRLLALLAANRPAAFCQKCLAESLEANLRDTRAAIKIALLGSMGVVIRRGACDRCRLVAALTVLKA